MYNKFFHIRGTNLYLVNNIVSCDEPTKIGHFLCNKINSGYNIDLNNESDFQEKINKRIQKNSLWMITDMPENILVLHTWQFQSPKDLFIKNRSKLSKVLLLCLLRFFMNKSLGKIS